MSETTPDRGFIRVDCQTCGNPDVWFSCNTCKKSDHFALHPEHVDCSCGATYTHGTCTCGASVPLEQLRFVAYDEGPLALADLEVAWGRVALLVVGVLVLVGGIAFALLT